MKKTTIFIIAVVYLLSIYVVTLFGMKIKVDQFEIYVEKIEITTYDTIDIDNVKRKSLVWNDNTENTFFVDYSYSPKNATQSDKVKFSIVCDKETAIIDGEEKQVPIAMITDFGKVVFNYPGLATITVFVPGGFRASDTLRVSCRKVS